MRIADYLLQQDVSFEVLPHPPAFTSQKLARTLRISGTQVAKGVLLRGENGFVLAVLSATHHVDTPTLAEQLGEPIRLASEEEVAEVFQDCEWGVVPPFGALYGLRTVLDESLSPAALIVFEGNTHVEAIRICCRDFERLEKPRRLHFALRESD